MSTPEPVLVLNMKSSDTLFEEFPVLELFKSQIDGHFLNFMLKRI